MKGELKEVTKGRKKEKLAIQSSHKESDSITESFFKGEDMENLQLGSRERTNATITKSLLDNLDFDSIIPKQQTIYESRFESDTYDIDGMSLIENANHSIKLQGNTNKFASRFEPDYKQSSQSRVEGKFDNRLFSNLDTTCSSSFINSGFGIRAFAKASEPDPYSEIVRSSKLSFLGTGIKLENSSLIDKAKQIQQTSNLSSTKINAEEIWSFRSDAKKGLALFASEMHQDTSSQISSNEDSSPESEDDFYRLCHEFEDIDVYDANQKKL